MAKEEEKKVNTEEEVSEGRRKNLVRVLTGRAGSVLGRGPLARARKKGRRGTRGR